MNEMNDLFSRQHGVASASQLRRVGISRKVELRLLRDGTLEEVYPRVLRLSGAPVSFPSQLMAATLAPGVVCASHGSAARLHELDGFDRYHELDVGVLRPMHHPDRSVNVHWTRGPLGQHVVTVAGIPVTTVAATLALLAAHFGIGPTAKALDSALRDGVSAEWLKSVASTWRRRGRSGPAALLMLLGERVDQTLPLSWFQRLAKRLLAERGIRLVDEYEVRDERGVVLAVLDLADPVRKVGVECQSWRWHATPAAQHRDARRRGMVRRLGWEVVDVWWSDLHQPDRVLAELRYLLDSRSPAA